MHHQTQGNFSNTIPWRRVDAPMSAIIATRTELMQRRVGIDFARQGRDLLFNKRMALVRELHQLDTDVTTELARATTLGRQTRADLDVALVEEGPEAVEGIAIGAADGYERFLEQVLRVVALEATVRRLTQEIARTTRQVNALENVVIPALEAEATQIAAVLDEREREEHSCRLVSIVGESGLAPEDRRYLAFARRFETEYVGQQGVRRTITETFDPGWHLLSDFAPDELKCVSAEHIARHHRPARPDDTDPTHYPKT